MSTRRATEIVSLACTGLVSAAGGSFFLLDGTATDLYADPGTGRVKACYVALELWLGSLEPTVWARPLELLLGGALMAVAVLAFAATRGRGPLAFDVPLPNTRCS